MRARRAARRRTGAAGPRGCATRGPPRPPRPRASSSTASTSTAWLAWLTDDPARRRPARRARGGHGRSASSTTSRSGCTPRAPTPGPSRTPSRPACRSGAPPDAFNARGQDWGLPPWRPDVLAASGYAPYRGLLQGLLRARGRPAHRPRDGPVPPLVGARGAPADRGHVRPLRRRGDARRPRPGGAPRGRGRHRGGPGHGRARRARGAGRAGRARHLGALVRTRLGGHGRPLPPERWRPGCVATATTHDLPSTAARLTGEHVELRAPPRPAHQPAGPGAERGGRAEVGEWLRLPRTARAAARRARRRGGARSARSTASCCAPRPGWSASGCPTRSATAGRRTCRARGTSTPTGACRSRTPTGRPLTLEELAGSPRLHALMRTCGAERGGRGVTGAGPVRHPRARGPHRRSLRLHRGQEERPARRRRSSRYDADDAAHVVPALALTRDDGDDPGPGLSVIETIGLFVVAPARAVRGHRGTGDGPGQVPQAAGLTLSGSTGPSRLDLVGLAGP